jgi:hypothetical protein
MSEQKPSRNVPRFTVTPTDGGSVTISPDVDEAKAKKEAEAKKTKTSGEGNA